MAKKKQLYPGVEQAEKMREQGRCHIDITPWEAAGYKTEWEWLEKDFHMTQEQILIRFNID